MRRLVLALVALSLPATADTFPVVETTIADLEAAYQSGAATPDDVVRAYLRRINQYDRTDSPQPINGGQGNQPLNSYMRVNPHALHDANKLDPNAGGPLFGRLADRFEGFAQALDYTRRVHFGSDPALPFFA